MIEFPSSSSAASSFSAILLIAVSFAWRRHGQHAFLLVLGVLCMPASVVFPIVEALSIGN
jgi:hypothetical protein